MRERERETGGGGRGVGWLMGGKPRFNLRLCLYSFKRNPAITRNNGAGDGFQRTVAGFGVDVFVSSACVSCLNKNTSRLQNLLDNMLGAVFAQVLLLRYMQDKPSIIMYAIAL